MYVDSKDYKHLANELKKDIAGLKKKMSLLEEKIKKKTKGLKKTGIKFHQVDWTNHETQIKWEIHLSYYIEDYKYYINYFPITSFEEKQEKIYLMLITDSERKLIDNKNIIVKVFRGHFIEQYKKRANFPGFKPSDVITQFFFDYYIGIIKEYKQNEEWYLFLNHYGIAFIKIHENYMTFDTFITLDLLKPDQEKAITDYLKELPSGFYIILAKYLLKNGQWSKYVKRNDLEKAVENFVGDKSIKQEVKEEFMKQFEKYDDWIKSNE